MKDASCVFYFSAYAFIGWLLERFCFPVLNRKPAGRGALHGFCPAFGFGGLCAVFSYGVARRLTAPAPGFAARAAGIALGALLSTLFAVLLEFTAGRLLQRLYGFRPWDYSRCAMNLGGYVCLRSSLLWCVLTFAAARLVQPLLEAGAARLPGMAAAAFGPVLAAYFTVDFFFTAVGVALRRYREHETEYRRDYEACVHDLLESPGVRSMEGFIQHGSVSCLLHCRHVSYGSYVVSRLLGLNARAAARGALLHDYFLYDWHRDAPYRWHGFRHPARALRNAGRDFELDEIEKNIILRHMWPLTPTPPQYAVSFVVSVADKICTVREVLEEQGLRKRRGGRTAG